VADAVRSTARPMAAAGGSAPASARRPSPEHGSQLVGAILLGSVASPWSRTELKPRGDRKPCASPTGRSGAAGERTAERLVKQRARTRKASGESPTQVGRPPGAWIGDNGRDGARRGDEACPRPPEHRARGGPEKIQTETRFRRTSMPTPRSLRAGHGARGPLRIR
jgi:hypothetical protein